LSKNYQENSGFVKIEQEKRPLYMNTNIYLWSYGSGQLRQYGACALLCWI